MNMYKNKLPWLNQDIACYLSDYIKDFANETPYKIIDNRMKHCLIEILRTCKDEIFVEIMRYLQTTHLATNKIDFFLERIADLRKENKPIGEEIEYQRWIHAGGHRAHTITIYLLDQPWYMFSDELMENLPK